MSTDNRTIINDCEANTGWTGDDTANPISTAGSFIQGSGALSTQLSNADEQMSTTQDSVGAGTFSLDWSDSTLYMNVKDSLFGAFSTGGVQFVCGDSTETIGYFVGGNDAVGMPGQLYFSAYKLDVSVIVSSPGTVNVDFTAFAGTEANYDQTASTRIGYGTIHLAKAVGSIDNVIMDGFYYIANGSYALTINGGTSGTPETMADVVADDVTSGWNLVTNPRGSLYNFFGPTEWGESAASADHYFTADGEQWFWIGDNSGGHAVGATHFPFRVVGNATDTGSFIINNVVIVNTGTGSEFDCSSTDVDTLEIDGCTMSGLASFEAPTSGGTSRFCKNTIFSSCGTVTSNLCDMSGNSYLSSTAAADTGALFYDEALSGQKDLVTIDNSTFSQGANAHHAITFGTGIDEHITLTGLEFSGFSSSNNVNGSTLQFLSTTVKTLFCNLIDCTVDGSPASTSNIGVDDAAGINVTLVIAPKVTKFTVQDSSKTPIENVRVFVETGDSGGVSGFPYQDAVTTLTQSAGTATLTASAVHGLITGDQVVIRGAQPDEYNKVASITVTSTTVFTYSIDSGTSSPATGTPVFSYVPVHGTTDVNGEIETSKAWAASQSLIGWARKSSTSPYYKQTNISVGDGSIGTDQIITLSSDE